MHAHCTVVIHERLQGVYHVAVGRFCHTPQDPPANHSFRGQNWHANSYFLKIKFNRITPGSGSSWEAKLRAESRYWSAQNECGSGILRWNFSYGAEGYTAVHFSFYIQYLVFSYGAEGYTAVHFSFLHAVFSLLPPVKSYKIPSLVFNSVKQFEPSVNKKAHM